MNRDVNKMTDHYELAVSKDQGKYTEACLITIIRNVLTDYGSLEANRADKADTSQILNNAYENYISEINPDILDMNQEELEKDAGFINGDCDEMTNDLTNLWNRVDLDDKELFDHIYAQIKEYKKLNSLLLSRDKGLFFQRREISECLDKYWGFTRYLIELYRGTDSIRSSAGRSLLKVFLGLGFIKETERNGVKVPAHVSLLAPMSLFSLIILYDSLENYWSKCRNLNYIEKGVYDEIFISKATRLFRYRTFWDNACCQTQAYIAAEVNDDPQSPLFKGLISSWFPLRKFDELNAFEPINETRIQEKLEIELENAVKGLNAQEPKPFRITLLGHKTEGKDEDLYGVNHLKSEIGKYIEFKNKSTKNDAWMNLHPEWTTQDRGQSRDKSGVSWLCDRNALKTRLSENDLVFILDTPDLYKEEPTVTPHPDFERFYMQISKLDFAGVLREIPNADYVIRRGSFASAYDLLAGYCYGQKWGEISTPIHKGRKELIHTLAAESKTSVYSYYSENDEYAHAEPFISASYIRTEMYDGKLICISSTRKDDSSSCMANCANKPAQPCRKILVSVYQLIKYLALDYVRAFYDEFTKQNNCDTDIFGAIHILKNLIVAIDYSDWRNSIKFEWAFSDGIDTPGDVVNDAAFINDIKAIMDLGFRYPTEKQASESDMFGYCVTHAFYCAMYSHAQTIDDMLFLFLYGKKVPRASDYVFLRPEVSIVRNQSLCEQYGNLNRGHFVGKQLYEKVMLTLDTYSTNFNDRTLLPGRIKEAGFKPETVFANIKLACSANNYKDSALYGQVSSLLQEIT